MTEREIKTQLSEVTRDLERTAVRLQERRVAQVNNPKKIAQLQQRIDNLRASAFEVDQEVAQLERAKGKMVNRQGLLEELLRTRGRKQTLSKKIKESKK